MSAPERKCGTFYGTYFAISLLPHRALHYFSCLCCVAAASADNNAFDLIGPKVEVRVQRAGMTLPIAEVPNLQPRRPALGASRSARQPIRPLSDGHRFSARRDQSSARFLVYSRRNLEQAPSTKKEFSSPFPTKPRRRSFSLRPKPVAPSARCARRFEASPELLSAPLRILQQASLDRQRLEKYLEAVRETYTADPEQLKAHTTMLARSLNMRLDQQCFDKPSAQQVPCLTQNTDQLVLDDAHSQTMVCNPDFGHRLPICWRKSVPRRPLAAATTVPTSARSSMWPAS